PGLAKTTAVKALAARIEADFHRVQFTPDLLPADLTGTDVFRPQSGSFEFERGPLFHNIILADEINRAPAKVQSALLEAMAEQQITVGRSTWKLPELFMVMATLKPAREQASRRAHPAPPPQALLSQREVFAARDAAMAVHMAPALEEYLAQLVLATRDAGRYGAELKRWIAWGGSPRATIALDRCARAQAWLAGRAYVLPEDVHAIAHEVLRHRVLLSYEAQAEGVRPDQVIARLLDLVPLP